MTLLYIIFGVLIGKVIYYFYRASKCQKSKNKTPECHD